MKSKSNELFKAVRYALYAGATAAIGLSAAPVFAQDTAQDQDSQKLETITVTGSRIRKADIETAQPIVVMDRAAIEKQGFNSVADILQNMPEAGTPPISRASVLASGESVGGYYIDLRNLGANRTLVLINGKRLGTTTDGLQDLSQIPMAAIDRIEVLKDGASAIYGSDAIAGVVNIITRRNFDGAEASAYVGQYDQDDGAKQNYSMTLGAHSDRGSVTMTAEYTKEDPVWAKDRWYSAFPDTTRHPNAGWSIVSQWGNFFMPPGYCSSGLCALNPGGNPANPADWHNTGAGGAPNDRSNANYEMMLNTGIERHSLFTSGNYDITDHIRFTGDFLYNKRRTSQQVAGYPFQPAFVIPGSSDEYPNIGLSPDSYFNPTGEQIYFYRRGWEMPRTTISDLQTYRFTGTFEGDFQIGDHSWNWDVGAFVNNNDVLKVGRGDFALLATRNALGPSFLDPVTGRVTCGTPSNPIPYGNEPGSCVPWNPFLTPEVGGAYSLSDPAVQAYLFPYSHDTGTTRTVDYSANITGSVFTLPAGDLSLAAGYEHRAESGDFIPDAMKQSSLSTDLSAGPTGGKYKVDEYYLEVDVPVLRDVFLARELSFNVAGRYSKYSSFGDTTNAKFSLTWRPIDDLLVRANYAEGFRAPTIGDLYGGISGTFDYYSDPCDSVRGVAATDATVMQRCLAGFGGQVPVEANFRQPGQGGSPCATLPCQTGYQFFAGSNPLTKPETATSKTAGLVYSPHWVEGLDIAVDWFRIRINNAIGSDTMTSMLNDCYVLGVVSRCSTALFLRDPTLGGAVHYGTRRTNNAGWVETEGWDFGINYRLPEFSFGRFMVRWNTAYMSKQDSKADNEPTTPVGHFNGYGANFRTRSIGSVDWSWGDFGATFTSRYFSSIRERCSYDINAGAGGPECNMPGHWANGTKGNYNRTGANTFHDLQVRWTAPWNGTISVGANNVFDHEGPVLYSDPSSQYDYYGGFDIGRFYYVRYQQKF